MADFKKYFPILLKHEGGYVNHPNDPGGETKYGISKRVYPKEDIKNLTRERAEIIYYMDYWRPLLLDLVLSQSVAEIVFDHCVNAGKRSAISILQKCIGAATDGVPGSKTLAATNNYTTQRELFEKYKTARLAYYTSIVIGKPSFSVFLKGWTNRVNSFIYTDANEKDIV